jgi:hypothetical protein
MEKSCKIQRSLYGTQIIYIQSVPHREHTILRLRYKAQPVNTVLLRKQSLFIATSQLKLKLKSRYDWRTVSQSVSQYVLVSSTLWDLRPHSICCRNVAVRNLRPSFCGAPSLTRGRVCSLQCNHSMVRVAQNPKSYFTASSETPATWRAMFPYLYPPGTGWPSYTPGHWAPCTHSTYYIIVQFIPRRKHVTPPLKEPGAVWRM